MSRARPVVLLAALCCGAGAAAQGVISVMAGFVHHAEGDVLLDGKPLEPAPSVLRHIPEGRSLSVSAGRAEIQLAPSSYLRLGADSEITMLEAGLASAKVRLARGAAIVDLPVLIEKNAIRIEAAGAGIVFERPGLYRIEADEDGPAALRVVKGRATVHLEGREVRASSRHVLRFAPGMAGEPERFKDAPKDELAQWNEQRSAALVQVARERPKDAGGMSPLERMIIDNALRRPTPQPPSSRPPPSRPPSSPPPSRPPGGK